MKRLIFVIGFFLLTHAAFAQDHSDLVRQVKSELEAAGVDLQTHGLPEFACNPFQITKRVAWRLRAEGAGLLDKPAGNNCKGFATDIIAYANGNIVDILADGGGSNGPQWQCCDSVDPSRYRPAFNPDDPPPPPPPPVGDDFAAKVYAKLQELATQQAALAENVKQTVVNEAVATRGQEQGNADAIRADVKSWWKDAAMFLLEKVLPPALAAFGGWKLAK